MERLLDILLEHLYQEHVEYAVDNAYYGIGTQDARSAPRTDFLHVVRQSSTITQLFEKQFEDRVVAVLKWVFLRFFLARVVFSFLRAGGGGGVKT